MTDHRSSKRRLSRKEPQPPITVIEVLACGGCGRHVLAVGNKADEGLTTRIHHHKCSGQWELVETFELQPEEAENMIEEVSAVLGKAS